MFSLDEEKMWSVPVQTGKAMQGYSERAVCKPGGDAYQKYSLPTLLSCTSHQPRQHVKKQRHYFANKGPSGQGYGFSSGHVWM